MLAGFITIFLLNTLTSLLVHQKVRGMVNTPSPIDTTMYAPVLHAILAILAPVLGGVVVGYLTKQKGAFYGGALAVTLKIISITIITTIFFKTPTFYGIQMDKTGANIFATRNIMRELLSLPLSILFIAWGGWVGEKLAKYRPKILTSA